MSNLEGIRSNIAQQVPSTQTGVEALAEARGARRSEGVVAISAESKIADMAEEIGMSTAHRANRKDLGERVEKRGAATDFEALARVLRHLEKLPDMPKGEKLSSLVARLRDFEDLLAKSGGGGGAQVTVEDILEALREYDADVTHQDAMLKAATGYLSGVGADETLLALLGQAQKTFEEPSVREQVLAGLAAAEAASETGKTLGLDPAALREEYRALLRSQPTVASLYARLAPLVDASPGGGSQADRIEKVIDALLVSAGRDLAAAEGPSGDPVFLQQAKTELQQLKAMRSAIELLGDAHESVVRLRPELKTAPGAPSGIDFTARALEFASARQGEAFAVAQDLVRGFDAGGEDAPVLAANALRQAFSEMPDTVMLHRVEKGTAFFGLLDRLVAEEEAAFAAR